MYNTKENRTKLESMLRPCEALILELRDGQIVMAIAEHKTRNSCRILYSKASW